MYNRKNPLFLPLLFSIFILACDSQPNVEDLQLKLKKIEAEIRTKQLETFQLKKEINSFGVQDKSTENISLVNSIVAEKKPFAHYFEIQGQVASKKNILLTPELGGIITSIHVEEGEKITAGTLVATYSSSIINSNIEEIEEQLDLAQYYFDKQKSLKEKGVGTDLSFKEAQNNYNRLLKAKNTLLEQKSKFSLYAPFSGYVDKIFVSVGQVGGPASPVLRLISLNHMYVAANVSENHLSRINKGQFVIIDLPALNEKIEDLKIKRIGKQIDPVNRTISVEVSIPSKEKVIPNLMAVMNICDYKDTSSIIIPTSVLLENTRGKQIVKTIENNLVIVKEVKTGYQYNNETQIISGLNPGDVIITNGKGSVIEGQKVKVSNK
ncbi:efflux RND transporter periplasmic adaptor subunit [Flavobacteriales bacterium]|nr:efflux RND transporter periplasmic adaptor subunit [Flavobacteriales bacterium]